MWARASTMAQAGERLVNCPRNSHLTGRADGVTTLAPLLERTGDFALFLDAPFDEEAAYGALRRAERTGRPLGSEAWIESLERRHGRPLRPARRGPRPKAQGGDQDGALFHKLSP